MSVFNKSLLTAALLASLGTAHATNNPAELTAKIAVSSGHDCSISFTSTGTSLVALTYTLTADNIQQNTAGEYTAENPTADYVFSAGSSADCTLGTVDILMPVVGEASGVAARQIKQHGAAFLANTAVADLYGTADADGTGDPVAIEGAQYFRSAGGTKVSAGTDLERVEGAYPAGRNKVNFSYNFLSATRVGKDEGTFSEYYSPAPLNVRAGSYAVDAYTGWPRSPSLSSPAVGSLINGMPAVISLPAAGTAGSRAIVLKLTTLMGYNPYVGKTPDVSSVVNGEVYSATGVVTVSSS